MQAVEKPQNYQKTLNNSNNGADNTNYVSEAEAKILPSVQNALKNIIAKEGFTLYKLTRRTIASNGSNYMADLYEIDIKGQTNEGYKEIHLFLKHIIPVEAIQSLIDVNICYSHEVFFYNELSEVFNKLQENAKIPEGERFKTVKNYECNQDAMILENLARKGFKTLHRMDVMPIQFAELSITQLARLHGLSFVLKHKNRDYFEEKIKRIESPLHFDKIEVWKPFVKRQFENSTKYFGTGVQEKINQFLENKFIEKFPKHFKGVTDSIKCLCHGDFRISNVMFKDN
ncbi:jg3633, partial [Pararge aegeria aegeria]